VTTFIYPPGGIFLKSWADLTQSTWWSAAPPTAPPVGMRLIARPATPLSVSEALRFLSLATQKCRDTPARSSHAP
jgi:hypothetical protein